MKYDIEKEEQQFMNFINDQYNVYKEIDNIYRDYVKLPLLSKHAGMYAMMRLTNEALENGQEEVDYNDEGNWELVVAVHNKLIDFLSDTVGPHYDQRAVDIDAEDDEDFAKNVIAIVDATFSQALGISPAEEDDSEQNGGMSIVRHDDEN